MRLIIILMLLFLIIGCSNIGDNNKRMIEQMVKDHAKAWETGDRELLDSLLHEDVVFAYPGRRLNKNQTM